MALRNETMKQAIDQSISQGRQPQSNRGGLGRILPGSGARSTVLFDKNGVTPAGTYFYEQSGLPIPSGFDYNQTPTRRRSSHYIKDLSGTQKRIL